MNDFIPSEYYLSQNYPNPFREKTAIKYCVAYKTRVLLTVHNAEGKEIKRLVDEEQNPGTYEVEFSTCYSSESLPDGKASRNPQEETYFYHLEVGDFIKTKKMLLLK